MNFDVSPATHIQSVDQNIQVDGSKKINEELIKEITTSFQKAISQVKSNGLTLAENELTNCLENAVSTIKGIKTETETKLKQPEIEPPISSSSPTPLAKKSLRPVFEELLKEVKEIIEEANKKRESASSSTIIETAKYVLLAIEHVKNICCVHYLLETVSDAYNRVKNPDELKKMVDGLKNSTNEKDFTNLQTTAKNTINTVPLQKKFSLIWSVPEVSNISSQINQTSETISITLLGNFKYITTEGMLPCLTFKATVLKPTKTHTTSLTFDIPFGTIFPNESLNQRQCAFVPFKVPYQAGWTKNSISAFEYELPICFSGLTQTQQDNSQDKNDAAKTTMTTTTTTTTTSTNSSINEKKDLEKS